MPQSLLTLSAYVKKITGKIVAAASGLLPGTCLLCGAEAHKAICAACQHQFFFQSVNRCISCALPLHNHDTCCGNCLSKPPTFHRTTVACDYIAPLDQLILALKFEHQLVVAPTLAQILAQTTLSSPEYHANSPDLFIPVPLGQARLSERGFNQAYEIARPFAKQLGRPVYPQLLLRVRDTAAQTLLHPDQRQDNIRDAFSPNACDADKIRGQHIGVIDDVMTTGATLHEIAACLKRHGAKRISNYVVARTLPH